MDKIAEIKRLIIPILKEHGVKKAAFFGSVARGEAKSDSDVDVLVESRDNIGLFEFVGLKQDLEDKLGRKVDLVEYRAIKSVIKKAILKDQVPIL
jgi:predicted nucleotidyltransferase